MKFNSEMAKNQFGRFCLLVLLQVAVLISRFADGAGHEIVVIERTLGGAYVATSEQYYAFTHPVLAELSWRSVSVRGNQVVIYKDDNSTSLRRWDKLEESSRDLISDLRSEFIANLAGLTLANARRPPPTSRQQYLSGGDESWRSSPPTGVSYPAPVMSPPPPSPLSAYGYQPEPMIQARAIVSSEKYRQKKSNRQPQGGKKYTRKDGSSSGSSSGGEYEEEEDNRGAVGEDERLQLSFNYHNTHQTDLHKKLTGDVYHFDMRGNILDVFSSTVSIKSSNGASLLYRDKRFFSYSAPTLPLSLHRLFFQGEFAFFVYKNSNVLVKSVNLLNPEERKLLGRLRALVKRLCYWQNPAPGFVFALPAESTKREQTLTSGNITAESSSQTDSSGQQLGE